jgi:hypothetical protein
MIHDQDLPMFLWVEACNTSVYIQNKCPHGILEDKTMEEAFTGVKPEVSHFHIFVYPVYIHVPVEKRTKLEPSSRKGLFVGYNEISKDYRVYILEQRKTVVRKDVKFEEDFASRKSHEPILVTEDTKHETPMIELGSSMISIAVQHPSGEEGEIIAPSITVKRPQ